MPNDSELHAEPGPQDPHQRDSDHPGYETTDINPGGVAVFLAGLFGFVLVFFLFCFVMGKVINKGIEKADGPVTKWNTAPGTSNVDLTKLTSNPAMQQQEFQRVASSFPEPRLEMDDGMQNTADLHAREDLLLDNYSSSPDLNGGIRIPISRAMELVVQHGLPVNAEAATGTTLMAGDERPQVEAPLTSGFARTGYELDVIEAREQKINYGRTQAENTHAQLATPAK